MRPWTGGSFVLSLLLSLQLKVIFFHYNQFQRISQFFQISTSPWASKHDIIFICLGLPEMSKPAMTCA